MQYVENVSKSQEHKTCSPCSKGKAARAPFKKQPDNIYELLKAISTDTTGPLTPEDTEKNKFIPILVDACFGWSDAQIMRKKCGAGLAIMRSPAKLQRLCVIKAKRLHSDEAKE